MPRFFDDGFSPDKPYLRGEHCRHIGYALRMRPGEVLTICACGVRNSCRKRENRFRLPAGQPMRIIAARKQAETLLRESNHLLANCEDATLGS